MTFVGGDRLVEACALAVGELLLAAAQDHPDAVERVVLAAAVAVDLLLDPAPHFVDGLGAELDHMEGVEHGGGVLELVVDGVLVAVERVEGGDLDTVAEVLATLFEPVAVGLPGPAGHQVQQPRPRVAVLIGSEVDHPGQLLGPTATIFDRELADVVPHMLIDPEALHAGEPGVVVGHLLQQRSDRGPHGVPRRPELSGDPADRGVLAADLVDRPPARPRRQQSPRPGDLLVLLGEDLRRTRRLDAAPGPLAPDQPDRPVEARRIDQHHVTAAVAARNDTARRATHRGPGRLDPHREQPDVVVELDGDHVQLAEPDEQVATRAVVGVVMAARSDVRRRLRQRRGLPDRVLGRSRSWRPRPLSPGHHDTGAPLTPTGTRKSRYAIQARG